MRRVLDCLKYLPYLAIHPFDGFYEARFRDKGSTLVATLLFFLYGIIRIFTAQYTAFINNFMHLYGLESTELFISGTLPIVLFFVSNYSAATLMNGNGRFRDIYMVTCYSLAPLIVFGFFTTIISNVIIVEELPILNALYWVGVIWFLFLLFVGLCVVHEYTVWQNFKALFLTFVAAIIILFLAVLLLTLVDRMTGFFTVLVVELSKRWR